VQFLRAPAGQRSDHHRLPGRLREDATPAIVFGDLRDPGSPVAKALAQYQSNQIRPELKLNTGVRYHGL